MVEQNFLDLLLSGSATAIMAVGLWAFLTGRLMSRKTHDEIVEQICTNNEKTMEILANKIAQKLDELTDDMKRKVSEGVQEGMVKGYIKINGGKDR